MSCGAESNAHESLEGIVRLNLYDLSLCVRSVNVKSIDMTVDRLPGDQQISMRPSRLKALDLENHVFDLRHYM